MQFSSFWNRKVLVGWFTYNENETTNVYIKLCDAYTMYCTGNEITEKLLRFGKSRVIWGIQSIHL